MSEPLPPTFQSRLHSESDFPAEFVRLHLHRVFTLIFRIVGDRDETQELTQETFIKVFQRKGASTDLRKAAAALPAIAAITAVQWLRQNEPRQAGFRFADLAPLGPQSSSRDLRAALDLLSPQERATFLLCDIEGIDIVEIARYTNDSAAAIRASIAQARTKLRQHLQAEERLMSDKIALLKHPPKDRLALYATSDLPAFQGLQIRRHISNCESCRNELEAFRRTLRKVQNAARAESSSSDAAGEWARLEQEILGNIAVGLAAARCIDKVGASRRLAWSAAVVVAVLSLLFVVGWMTHIPLAQTRHLFASLRKAVSSSSRTEPFRGLDTENGGIAVKSQNGKLLLTIPHSARVWASGNSQLSASFVDEQTGRVVITTVYGPTAYHQAAYEKDSSH